MPALSTPHRWIDRCAASASLVCALHCALVPLLFVTLPVLTLALRSFSHPLHDIAQAMILTHAFERWFVPAALLLAAISLSIGWWRHRNWRPMRWLALGGGLLILGSYSGLGRQPLMHALLLGGGGLCVALAHFSNLRARPAVLTCAALGCMHAGEHVAIASRSA